MQPNFKVNFNSLEALEFIDTYIDNNPQLFSKTYSTLYKRALQQFKENKSGKDYSYVNGPFYGILMISLLNMKIYQKGETK